jgi:peptide/nickel transport system substrate-binding protein
MMNKIKRRPLVALALAAVTALGAGAAVAQDRQPSEQCPTVGGTLKFARTADVSDWIYNLNNPSIWAWPLVNLPLVRSSPDASTVEPAAAESWDVNEEYTEFTFHLRPGLKFSDGSELTSADVIDSVQSKLDDPQSTLKSRIPEVTLEAPDEATFVMKLAQPAPTFLESNMTGVGIYPEGSDPQVMMTAPVSSGPFMLADWQKGQLARLVRNPHYWNQPYPCLDEVQLLVVGDAATQALQLQAGQIDIAQELPPAQLQALDNAPGVDIEIFPSLAEELIRLQRVKQPALPTSTSARR